MDFSDQVRQLSAQAEHQLEHLKTEEATKMALVAPFINALGYNVFNPAEVIPEFTADVATKRGEKVDYAIMGEGQKPQILIECKWSGFDLREAHMDQLMRYFHVTEARFAILTNGVVYRFYTDLEEPNKMDRKPFLEVDIREASEADVDSLKRFRKDTFNVDRLVSAASEMKYTREITRLLAKQLDEPDEEFLRFVIANIYSGRFTQNARERFTPIIKRGFQQFINDRINQRLQGALISESGRPESDSAEGEPVPIDSDIVTTEAEVEGFHIVRAIVSGMVDPERVVMRDTKSYCGVLLDDNNRKPICRLWFNSENNKYLGLFDAQKSHTKVQIQSTNDIYRFAEELRKTVSYYDDTPTVDLPPLRDEASP